MDTVGVLQSRKGGPGDVVYRDQDHPITSVETPIIIEDDDEGVLNLFPTFLVAFANILLQITRHEDRWTASQLVDLFPDTSFDLNMLSQYIESVADCNDVTTKNTRKLMKDEGFRRDLVRGGIRKKDGCGILNVKDVNELLSKQVEISGKADITFHPGRENAFSRAASPSTITDFVGSCYEKVKKKVMRSRGSCDL